MMSENTMRDLSKIFSELMMRGASEYIRAQGKTQEAKERSAEIVAAIKTLAPKAIDTAMREYEEATEARIEEAGRLSLNLTFRLAGIEAAKSVIG